MRVEFVKGETTRYRSLLHRPDGVVVAFEGGSYNKVPAPVPHDLAHLVVEHELGLTRGVWGVLAAGAWAALDPGAALTETWTRQPATSSGAGSKRARSGA